MFATLGEHGYSTIISYACVGYEFATVISYPTRVCGVMIVLLKMLPQGKFWG